VKKSILDRAIIVPGMPQPLLAAEKNSGWKSLRQSFQKLQAEIEKSDADIILYFSTQWPSVIGYLFQANPKPKWTHVDHEWHELGSMPYEFAVDGDFAKTYADEVRALGYNAATVNYRGFPIDTGTIVAQAMLNPKNRLPAAMVSCGLYAEKEETLQIGRAAGRALAKSGKKAIAVAVTALSHRLFNFEIDPREDRIYSAKDDEWNQKILEILAEGRLEDVSQVAREFAKEAQGDMGLKAIWWLSGLAGESNAFKGKVYDYKPIWGSGAAIVELTPTRPVEARNDPPSNPFDGEGKDAEDTRLHSPPTQPTISSTANEKINAKLAAEPVGPYPHARREGNLLFLSGIGPREPGKKAIPGVEVDEQGKVIGHDIDVQTRSVVRNLEAILESAGAKLEDIIDVQVFLTNMKRDFPTFNKVYGEYFAGIGPTRTTIEVGSLPTPIAVEFKVIARAP
jgi:2-aminophenol/2-amino-5-chlorophenol 1,6-dioxygenase alpha subunit